MEEYVRWDATEMAARIRSKDVTADELLEAAIRRMELVNPNINAVVHHDLGRARAAAKDLPQGDFQGVPFLLKDLLGEDRGQPSTGSFKLQVDFRASEDAELVKRFKNAGLNIERTPFGERQSDGSQ